MTSKFAKVLFVDTGILTSIRWAVSEGLTKMKVALKGLYVLGLLICLGCAPAKNATYAPSLTNLESSDTLVMKLRACHWGCTKGTVKFRNGKASLGKHTLDLTPKEMLDLNRYFAEGKALDSAWECSLPIYISFKQKRGFFTTNSKERQIYPCPFREDDNFLHPELLVRHFTETPMEIPYWRLSPEEQSKINVLILPDED